MNRNKLKFYNGKSYTDTAQPLHICVGELAMFNNIYFLIMDCGYVSSTTLAQVSAKRLRCPTLVRQAPNQARGNQTSTQTTSVMSTLPLVTKIPAVQQVQAAFKADPFLEYTFKEWVPDLPRTKKTVAFHEDIVRLVDDLQMLRIKTVRGFEQWLKDIETVEVSRIRQLVPSANSSP